MSKAKHNCTCNHENVSYCKTCKVCHCADCNQEWTARGSGYNPYYWGLNTQQLGQGLYKTTTLEAPRLISSTTVGPVTTVTACKHL